MYGKFFVIIYFEDVMFKGLQQFLYVVCYYFLVVYLLFENFIVCVFIINDDGSEVVMVVYNSEDCMLGF